MGGLAPRLADSPLYDACYQGLVRVSTEVLFTDMVILRRTYLSQITNSCSRHTVQRPSYVTACYSLRTYE